MKLKLFIQSFALMTLTLMTLQSTHHFARADDDPPGPESCDKNNKDDYDEDDCKTYQDNLAKKATPGPSGVPTGPVGPAAPGTSPVKSASCALTPPDNFKDQMTSLLGQIKAACPSSKSDAKFVDDYVTNYLNKPVLPPDYTCSNYEVKITADYSFASGLPATLPSAPANTLFSTCWVTADSSASITTYTLIDGCLNSTKTSLLGSFKTSCTTVRTSEFRQEQVSNALSNLAKVASDSSTPAKCKDVVTPILGFVGEMAATTPMGIAAPILAQIAAGPLAKLFNTASKHDLTGVLAAEAKKQQEGVTACTYLTLVQGMLGCEAPSKKATAAATACTPDRFNELKPTLTAWRSLNNELSGIQAAAAKGVVDPKDTKAENDAFNKMDENSLIAIAETMKTKVVDPNDPAKKPEALSDYLGTLAKPNSSDDLKTKLTRLHLAKLLEKLGKIEDALVSNASETDGKALADLRTQIVGTLMGGMNGNNVANPIDVVGLMNDHTGGLQSALIFESNQALTAAGPVDDGTKEEDANHVLNALFGNKDSKNPNIAELRDFVNNAVKKYTTSKEQNTTVGLGDKMIAHEKQEAVQACSALASSYYYLGGEGQLYENGNTVNKNFAHDYQNSCGALFKDNPELQAIHDSSNPAAFKKNVCSAENAENFLKK